MHSYQLLEPISNSLASIEIGDKNEAPDDDDSYREVRIRLDNGAEYFTVFFSDPQKRGRYWFEDPHMSIVNELSLENVICAVSDFISRGCINDAFERLS